MLHEVLVISTIIRTVVFSIVSVFHHVHVELILFVVSLSLFFCINKHHCGELSACRCLVFRIKYLRRVVSVVRHYAYITFLLFIPYIHLSKVVVPPT